MYFIVIEKAKSLPFSLYRYLTNPDKDKDLWKWATEGLAYLTLDADIKELIMENTEAIKSLVEVAKVRLGYL